ncbi:MAG: response regulator transcription factor [Chloroflexota bacterium]|nr:MAG: response regulator transcription factor [Chloroflexota bacterium]
MQAILFCHHADESNVIQVILHKAGFMVRSVNNLDLAIEAWPENPADLIMVVLTGEHSKSLVQIKQLRAHTVVPIFLVADLLPDDIHVDYLEAGADLVVIRPYSVRVLLSQIRAIIRRSTGVPFFSLPRLSQQDIILDPSDRTVQVGEGESKRLTHLEFRLLFTLMTHVGQIIPTDQIVEHVWGYTGEGNRELVRGLIQRVRSKIEADPRNPQYILTEVGIGYYFTR